MWQLAELAVDCGLGSNSPLKMSTSPLVLHTYWRSSCSYRVRIVLAFKSLPYESVPVHLVRNGGEQHSASYVALNPSHKVPLLVADGLPLTQSTAIAEYLEELHPQPSLLPGDAATRAHIRALCCVISNDMQPLGNLATLQHVAALVVPEGGAPEAKAAAREAWARHWMATGFAALEALMAPKAGRYSVGDAFTLADAFLAPQAYNAARVSLDMTPYPTIVRVMAELDKHPAVMAAHPSAQPDAE